MIPFGDETVTLIKRTETLSGSRHIAIYSKIVLEKCSWRRVTQYRKNGETHVTGEHITVRIPAGQTAPATGDMLIYGAYSGSVENATQFQQVIEAMRKSGGAFLVQSVADNTMSGAPIPHYKATGWL